LKSSAVIPANDAAGYFDTTLRAAALAIDAIRRGKMTLEPIGHYLCESVT